MDDDEPELDGFEEDVLVEDALEEDEDDSLLPEPEPDPELPELPDPEDSEEPEDPEEPFEEAGVDELEDDLLSVR